VALQYKPHGINWLDYFKCVLNALEHSPALNLIAETEAIQLDSN
jgi:hypothetical protein